VPILLFWGETNDNTVTEEKLLTRTFSQLNMKHPHDDVALIYGMPPTNIPSKYDFPQGL